MPPCTPCTTCTIKFFVNIFAKVLRSRKHSVNVIWMLFMRTAVNKLILLFHSSFWINIRYSLRSKIAKRLLFVFATCLVLFACSYAILDDGEWTSFHAIEMWMIKMKPNFYCFNILSITFNQLIYGIKLELWQKFDAEENVGRASLHNFITCSMLIIIDPNYGMN